MEFYIITQNASKYNLLTSIDLGRSVSVVVQDSVFTLIGIR